MSLWAQVSSQDNYVEISTVVFLLCEVIRGSFSLGTTG